MGVGFPQRAGRYQREGSLFFPRMLELHIYMEGFLVRGWELILLGYAAGPRRCPEGQFSLRAGSMSSRRSVISRWGWDSHTVRGGIESWDHCFRHPANGVVDVGSISRPGM